MDNKLLSVVFAAIINLTQGKRPPNGCRKTKEQEQPSDVVVFSHFFILSREPTVAGGEHFSLGHLIEINIHGFLPPK